LLKLLREIKGGDIAGSGEGRGIRFVKRCKNFQANIGSECRFFWLFNLDL
jgi:hypothetical protein